MDYAELANLQEHDNLNACLTKIKPNRVFALTTKTDQYYTQAKAQDGDAFLFGPETRGLPAEIINSLPPEQRLTIPMVEGSRSLNLANAVSIIAYDAWRQLGFKQLQIHQHPFC